MGEHAPTGTVSLFVGNQLIANRRITTTAPDAYYDVDGVRYRVIDTFGPVLGHSGGHAWDLQVEPAWEPSEPSR